jgi:hypothetical protein
VEEIESGAMRLIGAKTATAVLARRVQRRRDGDGFIVPPPLSLEELARAKMEEPGPGETKQRNAALQALVQWLDLVFQAGGNSHDLMCAWEAVKSPFPARIGKGPVRSHLDALLKRANVREAELNAKAEREAAPELAADWKARELRIAEVELAKAEAEKTACAAYAGSDGHARLAAQAGEAETRAAIWRKQIERIEAQ